MTGEFVRAEAELWRLPLSGPTGGSGLTSVDVITVELADADGIDGMAFSYALGGGGATVAMAANDFLARFVIDQPAIPPTSLWRRMHASLNRLGRGIGYVAMAAIDVAAWDHPARKMQVPLARALGGEARAVPVYGSGGFRPNQAPEDAVVRALEYAAMGVGAVKVRLAGDPSDAARLRAVAEALPPGVDLLADVNEKSDLARAMWLANLASEVNALWLEEPLPASDIKGYAALAQAARVPIATGEHLQRTVEVLPFIEDRSLAVIQPDLAMMGGITECLRVAHLAEHFGLVVSPHFLPALFVHLAAAAPAIKWLEHFPLLEVLFDAPAEMDGEGRIVPPERPGHGLQFAPGARERYWVAH